MAITHGSAGTAPRLVATHVVALYQRDSGDVLHLHVVRAYEGATDIDRDDAEQTARRQATAAGHDVDKLAALHAAEMPSGFATFRVDTASGELHGVPMPKAGAGR